MSSDSKPKADVRAAKQFQSNIKKLAKRYRNIRKDVRHSLMSFKAVIPLAIVYPELAMLYTKHD